MKRYEVTADGLNVRSGPATEYPRLGTVLNSAQLDSPDSAGWVPVLYNGNIGWCSAKYLLEVKDEPAPKPVADPPWIAWARQQLGTKEAPGAADNDKIVRWDELTTLPEECWHDATAWCAVFVNAAFAYCGIKTPKSAAAADWLKFGTPVVKPQLGDVVVFKWDDGQYHVALVLALEGGQVQVIGGNQSNAVTIANYPKTNVMGFRRPKTA